MSDRPSAERGADVGVPPPAARLAWIDNLRTLMIVLVVNMHACVTYSHVGGWYIKEAPEPAMPVKLVFILWQAHLQAFFMGLLFFLAGMFAHRSLMRRGPKAFLCERGRRLGLPALLFMAVIHPFIVYMLLGDPHVADRPSLAKLYGNYITSGAVFSGSGPMWFALALLLFCAVLAVARRWKPVKGSPVNRPSSAPGSAALLGFGVGLVLSTFVVRLVQPFGTSVLNFQLCFFPQYLAAFAVGVVAERRGWLERLLAARRARVAGWLGFFGSPVLLAVVIAWGGPPPEHGPIPYAGGWNLRALAFATWEQLAGLGIALGLMVWFRGRGNGAGRMSTWLSERSFTVYLLHTPVLVALTLWLRPATVNPFLSVALLTMAGLAVTYLVADLARRVPGFRHIL